MYRKGGDFHRIENSNRVYCRKMYLGLCDGDDKSVIYLLCYHPFTPFSRKIRRLQQLKHIQTLKIEISSI